MYLSAKNTDHIQYKCNHNSLTYIFHLCLAQCVNTNSQLWKADYTKHNRTKIQNAVKKMWEYVLRQ